jgi:hypothetical protein
MIDRVSRRTLMKQHLNKLIVTCLSKIKVSLYLHANYSEAASSVNIILHFLLEEGGALAPCDFSYAGPLAETVLLGNVAFRSGRKPEWDSVACKVTNTREAGQLIRRL